MIAQLFQICNACVMPNEGLLTAKEKAAELSISRSTLTRKVRAGEVVPVYRDESNPYNGVMLFHPETPPAGDSPQSSAGVPLVPKDAA